MYLPFVRKLVSTRFYLRSNFNNKHTNCTNNSIHRNDYQ